MKRPAFQFYPADWRKDSALQSCSLAARGLWMELLCIAHDCTPYGVLEINGHPMTVAQIARLVGESASRIKGLLEELEQCGVFARTQSGSIYSRRMVRDEHIRDARAQAGRLGGNPNLLKQKDKQKDNHGTNHNQTPSSSSSSSSTSKDQEQEPNQKQGRASAPPLPDWLPESAWNDWHAFRNARKGWTSKARELSLRTLTELRGQGHDPRRVIEQSIERGWTGLFPIRVQEARGSPKPPIAQQFAAKTYAGTPPNELPDYLRS